MTKFSNKLKKNPVLTHFGSIFPIFGAKRRTEGWREGLTEGQRDAILKELSGYRQGSNKP